jgi:acyl carrier protein
MDQSRSPNAPTIEKWLASLIGELLDIAPEKIDVTKRFDRYGLDSAAAISVTASLEKYLGRALDSTLLYNHPTIQKLASHLAGGQ